MSEMIDLFDVYNYKLAAMQAVFPIKIEKDKYLYNNLQDTDLISSSKWFTPLCSESLFDTSEKTSQITGVFDVCCKGVIDERVKKWNILRNSFCVGFKISIYWLKSPRDLYAFASVVPAHVVLERYFNDMYPKSKKFIS